MTDISRPAREDRTSIRQGILAMVGAVLAFQVMGVLAKWLAEAGYPVVQIIFFRSVFGLIPVLWLIARSGGLRLLRTPRPFAQIGRGLLGCIALGGFFFAVSMIPLAEATAIGFTAPLFITALSVPMLGEKVGLHRWSAVLAGFVGVMIMLRPTGEGPGLGALLALVSSIGYAVAMIASRTLSRTEPYGVIVFYNRAVIATVFGSAVPFSWMTPTWSDLLLFLAIGAAGGMAQWWQTKAFSMAPVAVVSPFNYTALVWSALLGFLIWGDMPPLTTWAGSALVIASGLYILHRETRAR